MDSSMSHCCRLAFCRSHLPISDEPLIPSVLAACPVPTCCLLCPDFSDRSLDSPSSKMSFLSALDIGYPSHVLTRQPVLFHFYSCHCLFNLFFSKSFVTAHCWWQTLDGWSCVLSILADTSQGQGDKSKTYAPEISKETFCVFLNTKKTKISEIPQNLKSA